MGQRTAGLVLGVVVAGLTGCGEDASDQRADLSSPTISRAPATEEPYTPVPTLEPEPIGVDVVITCFDKKYNEHVYGAPEAAWSKHYDYCDSEEMSGTLSAREMKAVTTAYKKADLFSLTVLYDMCATNSIEDFAHLKQGANKKQIQERIGMLILCPDHPLADTMREYLGIAAQQYQLEEDGRIFYSGTYRVNKQIKPGTYFSKPGGDDCYWERTDSTGEIIDNNFTTGLRVQVDIKTSDYSFSSDGCGRWQPVG
jgi:hypothetical protein